MTKRSDSPSSSPSNERTYRNIQRLDVHPLSCATAFPPRVRAVQSVLAFTRCVFPFLAFPFVALPLLLPLPFVRRCEEDWRGQTSLVWCSLVLSLTHEGWVHICQYLRADERRVVWRCALCLWEYGVSHDHSSFECCRLSRFGVEDESA